MQLVDVHFPTTNERDLICTRDTHAEPERISSYFSRNSVGAVPSRLGPASAHFPDRGVGQTFETLPLNLLGFFSPTGPSSEGPGRSLGLQPHSVTRITF
jgi:hypothetical protein